MSASLVGSEMCIRDSCSPVAPAGRRVRIRGKRPCPDAGRDERGGLVAVSYTHLTLPTICSV
eukprot:5371608-Alexandrium_andersonii.AAC.1